MKHSLSVVCLSLLLFHTHFSLAKKGSGGFGKSFGGKKLPTSNRGSTNTNSNAGNKNNKGSSTQGGYPKQPGQPNQGGRPGYPGSYPQQPGGGYHNQYPARGSPYRGGYGGYGGGYINHNPNNKVLSPHYGGSFGYGGYGAGGGSPFSHSVQAMGMYPSDRSRGFGRSAVMAAAGGAMAGMALGYGLGRFPRPPFQFHNHQEEYCYNHYMHRRYGTQSTDTNDYGRDYKYSKPPETYDHYMDSCMKRNDLLPAENPKPNNKPAATTTKTTTNITTAAPDSGIGSNTTKSNSTVAENSPTTAPSPQRPLNESEAKPEPPASQVLRKTTTDDDDDDDDTVSIVEIDYPALIEQMKARKCLEMYMDYSHKYLKKLNNGVQRLEMGLQGLLAVVTSTTLMLLNSNMLMLLH